MKREPERLANERFDLLVVGAGIYGSTIAATAAWQGLKVALIDKGDFGHATSANSQKIVHGGLRYLQHLDLRRMRESIAARRCLMRIAPNLVQPLQCIVPTRGRGLRSRPVMAVALTLNDLVSWDRNRALDEAHRLPRGRTVSAAECLRMIPGLDRSQVSGGAVWFDAMASNTERLTLAFVSSAAAKGACVANYVQAMGYRGSGENVWGVAAKNVLGDDTFDIRASVVINAMGPWSSTLPAPDGDPIPGLPRCWCRAMNMVINRRLFGDYAVGLSAGTYVDRDAFLNKGTRDFFFVPWRESTIIGTFYDRVPDVLHREIGAGDVHRMLREINSAYPTANLQPSDVGFVHAGLLPEASNSNEPHHVRLLKHTVSVDAGPAAGSLLSVVGVKYTTAVQTAERIVGTARGKISQTPGSPFPATERDHRTECATGLETGTVPSVTADRLRDCYGSAVGDVWQYLGTQELRRPLSRDRPVLTGEITYAVRKEMAQKLSDVVLRRTGLGSDRYPGRTALLRCGEVMATEHGWTKQKMMREIDEVEQTYAALFDAGCIERPGPIEDAADNVASAPDYRRDR